MINPSHLTNANAAISGCVLPMKLVQPAKMQIIQTVSRERLAVTPLRLFWGAFFVSRC